jgi:methyl-accepting chemotaxis protein
VALVDLALQVLVEVAVILVEVAVILVDAGGGGGSGPGAMSKMASSVGKAFGTLVGTTGTVIGGLDRMSSAVTNTIKQFANVGNDLNAAANIFSSIPIVGTMFTAVAGAATSVAKSFNEVSKSGATFSGSITAFSAAASSAGMTMEQFGWTDRCQR